MPGSCFKTPSPVITRAEKLCFFPQAHSLPFIMFSISRLIFSHSFAIDYTKKSRMPLRYITTLNLINTITNRCFGVKHKSPALGNCKKGNDRKKIKYSVGDTYTGLQKCGKCCIIMTNQNAKPNAGKGDCKLWNVTHGKQP
jgi:hypothetical protein